MVAAIERVLVHPQLAGCFDPATSRGEVPLMGTLTSKSGPRSVSGQVDRLAVLDDRVVVLDFKTSLQVPQSATSIPADYVTQMALYHDLVARLYGGKKVDCMLVWTHAQEGPVVMQVPESAITAALNKIAQL